MSVPLLLVNFAYCTTTASVAGADLTITVDECGRLPSSAQLGANDFYLTFESTYAANNFEIVKVTAKSAASGPGTLTVVRSQEGTSATTQSSGVVLKGAVTAGILARVGKTYATRTYSAATFS